jgi:hypothetical protein
MHCIAIFILKSEFWSKTTSTIWLKRQILILDCWNVDHFHSVAILMRIRDLVTVQFWFFLKQEDNSSRHIFKSSSFSDSKHIIFVNSSNFPIIDHELKNHKENAKDFLMITFIQKNSSWKNFCSLWFEV